jgi:membrane-associated phospholipid phosphatase
MHHHNPKVPLTSTARLWLMAGMIAFHLTCYFSVNRINDLRSPSHFWNLSLPVDNLIPYFGWTWIFYYLGVPYMSFWAFAVMWNLPDIHFRSSLRAYLAMISVGATLQLLIPGKSPWPIRPVPFQAWMHTKVSYDPYVCFPSMHVALSILPACLSFDAFRKTWIRGISIMIAASISVSTITMKEHYFIDTLAGLALGLAAYALSRPRTGPPQE